MLSRSNQLVDKGSYYQSALNVAPTYRQSIFDNLSMGATGGYQALNVLDSKYTQSPEGQAALSSYKAMQLEADAPGQSFVQRRTNDVAFMVGAALNPLTWIGGGLGEAASEAISVGASKGLAQLPDAVSALARTPLTKLLAKPTSTYVADTTESKPFSAAFLTDKAVKNFSVFAGAGVPQAVIDNYNIDTDHIDWGGVARSTGEMGGLGLAIGSIPMVYGMIKAKVNRSSGVEPSADINQADLDKALEKGTITPQEHGWYSDFLEAKKNPSDVGKMEDLKDRASSLVNSNGGKANTVSHEASVNIIDPDNMKALQGVLSDQGLADLPDHQRKALSDFVIHGSVDKLSADQPTLDGIRGYVDMTKEKLDAREAKTAEADEITDKYLTRGVNENMPFSQKELYRSMKKMGFEESHVDHLPMIVPDNLKKRMVADEKINKFKYKLKKEKEKYTQKTYYRGESPDYPGQVVQYQMLSHDDEFGKGYWYAETKEHAEHYAKLTNSIIKELKGSYKLYDVVTGKDNEINSIYEKIKKLNDSGHFLEAKIQVEKLRNIAKLKGYDGLIRREGLADKFGARTRINKIAKAKKEIMFFEVPKSSKAEYEPNKQTQRRINELEASKPKVETPKEELEGLRQRLLGNGLPKNFERSKDYQRLMDLSNVWHNAKTLLDRVHLEDQYNKQSAIHDFLSDILKISDSDLKQLADPEKAMDYLRQRIEKNINKVKDDSTIRSELDQYRAVPQDAEQVLKDSETDFSKTKAKDSLDDFNHAKDKFDEFNKKQNVFKNLISCVLGSLNG